MLIIAGFTGFNNIHLEGWRWHEACIFLGGGRLDARKRQFPWALENGCCGAQLSWVRTVGKAL